MFDNKEEIEDWLKDMRITNYTINEDLTVDVAGCVDLSNNQLKELPVEFGKVSGYFYCCNNQLTSLNGCPKEIGTSFDCSSNQLIKLEYAPEKIRYNFLCENNQLITLEHAPNEIGGVFYCNNNELENNELYKMDLNQIHQYYTSKRLAERLHRDLPQARHEHKQVKKMKL